MKKQNQFRKIVLLPVVFALVSCGYELRDVYLGDAYNNPIFSENFYKVYDEAIDQTNPNNSIQSERNYDLTYAKDKAVLSYGETAVLDSDVSSYQGGKGLTYDNDLKPNDSYVGVGYGPTKKMSSVDSTFSYGYVSKLFDGQMFCHGGYELVRVQVDETGFGHLFDKQISKLSDGAYFSVNFKGAAFTDDVPRKGPGPHLSDVTIHVSFYIKDGSKYDKVTASYGINSLRTNYPESFSDGGAYTFFAFSLANIGVESCAGISLSYTLNSDEAISAEPDGGYIHSLLFYEVFFVGATWR